MGRYRLVATGDEHATIEACAASVNLYHVGHHVSMGQGVVDAIVPLRYAIADVGHEVACPSASSITDALHGTLCQSQQMCAAWMGIAKTALHQDLWLVQVFDGPPHAYLQGVVLWCQTAYALAV